MHVLHSTLLVLATQLTFSCPLQKLTYITEDYAPHNFMEDGALKGVSVDLLLEALKVIDCPVKRDDFKVLPWTRGYNMILNQPNIMLFGMTRLKEREDLFKWVGPYMTTNIALIAKKDSHIKIHNNSDLNQFTIGVIQDDVGEKLAKSVGIMQENLKYSNNHPKTLAKMLVLGRFDLWAYEINGANWMFTKLGYDIQQFEIVYSFNSALAFYALSKNISDNAVKVLQDAIDKVINRKTKSGRTGLDEIYIKYGLKH